MTDTAGKSALKYEALSGGRASGGSPTAEAQVNGTRAGRSPSDGRKFNLESEVSYIAHPLYNVIV